MWGDSMFDSLCWRMAVAGLFLSGAVCCFGSDAEDGALPDLREIQLASTLDGTCQPSLLWVPESARARPAPLLVYLHSWSGDYRQNNSPWHKEAVSREWIYLHPNFRGPNKRPEACGSELARQDVLDSIDHVLANNKVDTSRIYLAGSSGGGHMAMLMAAYAPHRFSAVSAWVGISDLAEWYRFHLKDGKPKPYARMVVASCGGPPGVSPDVDAQYRARSPIFHLHKVGDLPIDLNAGIHDGHKGSVPISHTLRAFNVIAKRKGHTLVSEAEMTALWEAGRVAEPKTATEVVDATYARRILLRRHADSARITIFDGGHEGLSRPACEWLAQQQRVAQ